MDNVLGPGVELIDVDKFKQEDICYSLTRSVEPDACPNSLGSAHCGRPYVGSHDVFVFSLKKKRSIFDFTPLDFNGDTNGQENVLIWFFQNVLGYRVSNPCKVINIYHQHCSRIHTSFSTGRVNNNGRSGTAGYTDQLF